MLRSPPSRRRGLKFYDSQSWLYVVDVASFAEAWIEMSISTALRKIEIVASFAEAWIEIQYESAFNGATKVASFAEAWIEIHTLNTIPDTV